MTDPIKLNQACLAPVIHPTAPAAAGGGGFAAALDRAAERPGQVKFSAHALERLDRRGIAADPATLGRLQSGVEKAAAKGSRDALVLVDSTAFVVSVRNRTVITAVGADQMRDRVFTQIDSAVIN